MSEALHHFRRIPRPCAISFSGGRTSGLMLRLFLDAYGGALPDDVRVLFANTGKERPETLDFVQRCSVEWDVPITWLEYDPNGTDAKQLRVVSHNSASRSGEPFDALIKKRNMLPNPVSRFCTQELKIRPMLRYCRDVLGWREWRVAIGLRADEQSRVIKATSCETRTRERFRRVCPLADANITRRDVVTFWREQPFDLGLPITPDGTTPHGNCDLCFLKSAATIRGLLRENPEAADWWIAQEARALDVASPAARLFRSDRPSYADLKRLARDQGDLLERYGLEDSDCACTD